ncbi:MAG TPA: putative ABC transporter permease [Microlunatus sp.]|nr:putative ABC transporter permease [Microlunatus sp.]
MFVLGMAVCTVLEYVASFVMEKLFGSVFWDYSEKPLNLQGRICLQYSLYWGFLSLLLIYVLDPATVRLVQGWPLPAAAYVLGVLVVLSVLSSILTLLAFRRFDQKVAYLKARRDGTPLPSIDGRVGRLVDRLVPDVVMINTFPRMSQIVEYMELTGERRKLIVADLHLGTPSARHLRHQQALARAEAAEGIAG